MKIAQSHNKWPKSLDVTVYDVQKISFFNMTFYCSLAVIKSQIRTLTSVE